jgi:hypothetical protein
MAQARCELLSRSVEWKLSLPELISSRVPPPT